jgi:hypothetical protein
MIIVQSLHLPFEVSRKEDHSFSFKIFHIHLLQVTEIVLLR